MSGGVGATKIPHLWCLRFGSGQNVAGVTVLLNEQAGESPAFCGRSLLPRDGLHHIRQRRCLQDGRDLLPDFIPAGMGRTMALGGTFFHAKQARTCPILSVHRRHDFEQGNIPGRPGEGEAAAITAFGHHQAVARQLVDDLGQVGLLQAGLFGDVPDERHGRTRIPDASHGMDRVAGRFGHVHHICSSRRGHNPSRVNGENGGQRLFAQFAGELMFSLSGQPAGGFLSQRDISTIARRFNACHYPHLFHSLISITALCPKTLVKSKKLGLCTSRANRRLAICAAGQVVSA